MGEPLTIGVVGLGNIWSRYSDFFARTDGAEVVAVSDLDPARAESAMRRWPAAVALDAGDLVRSGVDVVVNLTTPRHHAEVAGAAVAAGTAVYNEKPLAVDVASARLLVEAADGAGVRLGCAPDTVLGTGVQTARHLVDRGDLGTPVAASANMLVPGHESWHPDPDFYYQPGGGPLFDMGPYYLSALVHLLGPVVHVSGVSSRPRSSRVIASGTRAGLSVPVDVDTHVAGVLVHANGAISTITMSFDVVATAAAPIEVHGEQASLVVPDPNHFDGRPRLRRQGDADWVDVADAAGYVGASRGVGVIDMMGSSNRASADVALHVLDVMESLTRAATEMVPVPIDSTVERPPPVPLGPAR